jgi:putative transposase
MNFKERLPEKDIDTIVKIVFQKKSIKRKQRIIRRKYILLPFNEEEEKVPYIKNTRKEFWMPKTPKLFGASWDIKLLFKGLKSKYAIEVNEAKNVQVIEALIWKAMLTLTVCRRRYTVVTNHIKSWKKRWEIQIFDGV